MPFDRRGLAKGDIVGMPTKKAPLAGRLIKLALR